MRTGKVIRISTAIFLVVILCACIGRAAPLGMAFTYQGRLLANGEPANGTYDMQCKLFDASDASGIQVGDTLVLEDGTTVDGYFTVEMDFGIQVFNGEARYLEIAIRPWDSTRVEDFVTLSPRTELTATVYSLQTRGIYVDDNLNVGVGTTVPSGRLHAVAQSGTAIRGQTMGADDYAGFFVGGRGIGILGVGTAGGHLTLIGPVINPLLDSYGTLAFMDIYSSVKGSIVSRPSIIGDMLQLCVGNDPKVSVLSNGRVGIGTSAPNYRLEVKSSGATDGMAVTSSDGQRLLRVRENSDTSSQIQLFDNADTVQAVISGGGPSYLNAGNVGIGTSSPSEKLDVVGNIDVSNFRVKRYRGFPRPDYDSGWVGILPNTAVILNHNLGGIGYSDVEDYVVDLTFKNTNGAITNFGIGSDGYTFDEPILTYSGSSWRELTTASIKVSRGYGDTFIEQVRIRIWVYE